MCLVCLILFIHRQLMNIFQWNTSLRCQLCSNRYLWYTSIQKCSEQNRTSSITVWYSHSNISTISLIWENNQFNLCSFWIVWFFPGFWNYFFPWRLCKKFGFSFFLNWQKKLNWFEIFFLFKKNFLVKKQFFQRIPKFVREW